MPTLREIQALKEEIENLKEEVNRLEKLLAVNIRSDATVETGMVGSYPSQKSITRSNLVPEPSNAANGSK